MDTERERMDTDEEEKENEGEDPPPSPTAYGLRLISQSHVPTVPGGHSSSSPPFSSPSPSASLRKSASFRFW